MLQLIRATSSALLIAVIGLIGRAILDKLLAIKGGPNLVADWAQILSLTELFIGPISAGVGIGLTALVSRTDCQIHRSDILQEAWRGFRYALLASGLCLLTIGILYSWHFPDKKSLWPILGAATIAGIAGAYLSLLNAWWSGKEERHRILLYVSCNATAIALTAGLSSAEDILNNLIISQALIAIILLAFSIKNAPPKPPIENKTALKNQIDQYLIAGMVIGLMSPLSLLVIRYLLDQYGPTGAAGLIQSVWRLSEWVATPAATILAVYFLPKFSQAAHDHSLFKQQIWQASRLLLTISALAYLILFLFQSSLQKFLYSEEFYVPPYLLGMFFIGDWLRIASWIILFSFYARSCIPYIVIGEFFSLPLIALILWLNSKNLTEINIAIIYLSTYIAYLIFNIHCYIKIRLLLDKNNGNNHLPKGF